MHRGSLDTIVPSWQVSNINLSTNAPSALGDDVVAIPSASARTAVPITQTSRGNQQRRPPHAPRYFEDSDSGIHLSAHTSSQQHPKSGNSPSFRPSTQFDTMERTASGSSTHSGSSKRKRDFPNTQAHQQAPGPSTGHQSKGLAERLGIALPTSDSKHTVVVEDGQDDVQQQQNKKRKAKLKPNQSGQAGENGPSGQKPASNGGNLSPGMSLLQRLNMGGSNNTTQNTSHTPGQSNGAQVSNGQSVRNSPRTMSHTQRNNRPNSSQAIRPNAPSNTQPHLASTFSQMSTNSAASSYAPSGSASNRLKLSTTPSNPASLISRLSGAPAQARSPIPMAPIAPPDLVKSTAVTSVNGSKSGVQGNVVSGNAREQVRPLGPAIEPSRPAVVQSTPVALPFNPNDGIKRKGRGFANAGYAV